MLEGVCKTFLSYSFDNAFFNWSKMSASHFVRCSGFLMNPLMRDLNVAIPSIFFMVVGNNGDFSLPRPGYLFKAIFRPDSIRALSCYSVMLSQVSGNLAVVVYVQLVAPEN